MIACYAGWSLSPAAIATRSSPIDSPTGLPQSALRFVLERERERERERGDHSASHVIANPRGLVSAGVVAAVSDGYSTAHDQPAHTPLATFTLRTHSPALPFLSARSLVCSGPLVSSVLISYQSLPSCSHVQHVAGLSESYPSDARCCALHTQLRLSSRRATQQTRSGSEVRHDTSAKTDTHNSSER